jgi:DeoR family transcriptional regulator, catabolite repression regulator
MYTQNKSFVVGNVMLSTLEFPSVLGDTILKEAFEKMDSFGLGIVCVVNNKDELLGVITDGDIRRKLLTIQKPLPAFLIDDAVNQAIKKPITISSNLTLVEAVRLMEKKQVWDLPVVDNGKLVGLLHLQTAIKALLEE